MKAGLWQRSEWPVRITFHQPPDPDRRSPLDPPASHAVRSYWRWDRFATAEDPCLFGEVVLRGLKEGA